MTFILDILGAVFYTDIQGDALVVAKAIITRGMFRPGRR